MSGWIIKDLRGAWPYGGVSDNGLAQWSYGNVELRPFKTKEEAERIISSHLLSDERYGVIPYEEYELVYMLRKIR